MAERVKWPERQAILPVCSFDERSSPFQHSPTLCSLHLLDLIAKLWLSRVCSPRTSLPGVGSLQLQDSAIPTFWDPSLSTNHGFLGSFLPRPLLGIIHFLQWFRPLSSGSQGSVQWISSLMLLNHFHDLQAEMVHAILCLVQIICSYSPLHHMSSALRMSAIRKHINIFYQQITSNTVTPNLSSAYIKLLGEIEIQKWNFLTNWGQQL